MHFATLQISDKKERNKLFCNEKVIFMVNYLSFAADDDADAAVVFVLDELIFFIAILLLILFQLLS